MNFEWFGTQVTVVALLQTYGEALHCGHTRFRDRQRFMRALDKARLFFSDYAMVAAIPPMLEN